MLYTIAFSAFFTLGAVSQTLVPVIGAGELGLGAGAIGPALGAGGLCRLAGAAAGSWVSDHRGRKAALIPGLCLMTAGTLTLGLLAGPALGAALYGASGRALPLLVNTALLGTCAVAAAVVLPETLPRPVTR